MTEEQALGAIQFAAKHCLEALRIVEELAKRGPRNVAEYGKPDCGDCEKDFSYENSGDFSQAIDHESDCLWRRAVELVSK